MAAVYCRTKYFEKTQLQQKGFIIRAWSLVLYAIYTYMYIFSLFTGGNHSPVLPAFRKAELHTPTSLQSVRTADTK